MTGVPRPSPLAASTLALAAVVGLAACGSEPDPVPMPDVVGMTVDEVTTVLEEGEPPLEFRITGNDDERSVVVAQFPGAGEDVTGKNIRLTTRTVFEEAASGCSGASGSLADEGMSMVLDMKGDGWASGDLDLRTVECVLDALDVPESTWNKMLSTRSLDGAQTDGWDDIEATWRYHPDDGLDVVLEYGR